MSQLTEQESTFHNRAAIVITDILEQMELSPSKLKMFISMTETFNSLPPVVFMALGKEGEKIKKVLNDMGPLLHIVKEHDDPTYLIKSIPEERILYFINQVITRLEWVKNGNESGPQSE